GGLYADIDTLFLRPFPDELWSHPAVIGREADVTYEDSGVPEASVSNAIVMAEPGSRFIQQWRNQIVGAMDGSWSAHSCRLAARLTQQLPDDVHVEPQATFHPYDHTVEGMQTLLERPYVEGALDHSLAVHTCAHLWWSLERTDFTTFSATEATE